MYTNIKKEIAINNDKNLVEPAGYYAYITI